jgi:hypothetical protein
VAATVTAVRAGDRATEHRPDREASTAGSSIARPSPAEVLAALREAADGKRSVLIGYVDNQGVTVDRVVDPVHVHAGLFQRIHRLPGLAIVVDDVDTLRDPAASRARLAEFKTLVAVDRRIGLLHHLQEDVGLRKQLLDLGRGMGISRGGIATDERLFLRADHALRCGDVVSECGRGEAEDKHEKQNDGTHGATPVSLPISYVLHPDRFPVCAFRPVDAGVRRWRR